MAEDANVEVKKAENSSTTTKKRTTTRKKTVKKSEKKQVVFVKSKRKRAVARASSKDGTGRIRVNGFNIGTIEPKEFRFMMLEPTRVSRSIQDLARHMDMDINVYGGGQSSQAQAIRGVIAKSIVEMSKSEAVKSEFMRYDRSMLIDDVRRVEPKKFKGPKARARVQKSYR